MTSMIACNTFDCADPYALAQFWSQVVGHPVDAEARPDDDEVGIDVDNGPDLVFQVVPEPKTVKNRVHLCLWPDDTREGEVERLLGIGATMVADRRNPDGTGWAVLADPEGNEFCVLRGTTDRAKETGAG